MRADLPWHALEGLAVLVADGRRRVTRISDAASRLLHTDGRPAVGRLCYEVSALRATNGAPFCSESCPVRRLARQGRLPARHQVIVEREGVGTRPVDLLSFPLPADGDPTLAPSDAGGRCPGILHLFLPSNTDAIAFPSQPENLDRSPRLRTLTGRESEVLDLLARGMGTAQIAARLYISRTTVRNHVQHILRKLAVHRRLEAILLLTGRRP